MNNHRFSLSSMIRIGMVWTALMMAASASAQPLSVCATVPELGSLVREVGGDLVSVTVFAKPTEDPHFVEAKPSFVKALSTCDLYIQVGMDLEIGWAPVLLRNARNPHVQPGGRGYLDASTVITPLEVPTGPVDRSMGDVHPLGNPHYLLDPINGLRVARLIRDRLTALQPAHAQVFRQRYEDFRRRLGIALVGETLYHKYDFEKLVLLAEHDRLDAFLASQGDTSALGGWLGLLRPYRGARVVTDHRMWPYFARRFGLDVVDTLEPKPGIPPTTQHLNQVIQSMRANVVRAVLAAAYYDPRYARFVSEQTGATVVFMANQAGARPGTDEYLSMIDYNVRQIAAALGGTAT
ncbi:MAG: metal ABC transporter substrate-binding protein [Candidatus Binatia bacterium]|nr:metal ABC transporter substrate-binding protein [Candidatus Binatia bacterium]